MSYSGVDVQPVESHKHLGFVLDSKMSCMNHTDGKIEKGNQGIGIIRRLYKYLPRKALLQIYKSFIRPHLDYCDVIYLKPTYDEFYYAYYSERARSDPAYTTELFTINIDAVQYNAATAITGCIRGTSKEKLYTELSLTSLYDRRRFHRLSLLLEKISELIKLRIERRHENVHHQKM